MQKPEQTALDFTHPPLPYTERTTLAELRKGRANAVSVEKLEELTGMTSVNVRKTIRSLIMDYGYLIASATDNPPGYFIPETPDEILTATKSLRHRGIMILWRAARLSRMSVELVFNQARLEFEKEKDIPAVRTAGGEK